MPFLSASDLNKWLSKPEERHTINLSQRVHAEARVGHNPTVLAAATGWLKHHSQPAFDFGTRHQATVSRGIQRWFAARPPYTDLPRIDPERGLEEHDWVFLFHALAEITYPDEAGNRRNHSSLKHFMETRTFLSTHGGEEGEKMNATHQKTALERIMAASQLSLKTLQRHVVQRFGDKMEKVQEHYKVKRFKIDARAMAQQLRGDRAMEDPYYSKQQHKEFEGEPGSIVQIQSHAFKYKDDDGKIKKLLFNEGAWHLTGCLDGFSVHVTGALQYGARKVWKKVRDSSETACRHAHLHSACAASFERARLPTRCHALQRGARPLDFLVKQSLPSKTTKEKHYYMMLTEASHGVLACVAMRSGTSKELQNPSKMKFWYDHLQTLKIGSKQLEAELQATDWVRTFQLLARSSRGLVPRASACRSRRPLASCGV